MAEPLDPPLPAALRRLAAYSWRILVVGLLGYVALIVLGRLTLVVFPIYVALLLTVVLEPVARPLRDRGAPPLVATLGAFGVLAAVLALAGLLIVPPLADEAGDLEATITEGVDDIENWIVDDSPFDLSRGEVDDLRAEAGDALARVFRDNQDRLVSSAILAFEVVAGAILALVTAFFFVKDGRRFQQAVLHECDDDQSVMVRAVAGRIWNTLRGYMVGSATLGLIEGVVLAITLWLVGGSLIVPVGVLTFLAAFIPFVGAVTAGIIAVLVALVTASPGAAAVVAIVALVVQQLDNDLLAPVVFGKALALHPLLILFAVTAFGALFGVAGAFVAVPVTASVINGFSTWREVRAGTLTAS